MPPKRKVCYFFNLSFAISYQFKAPDDKRSRKRPKKSSTKACLTNYEHESIYKLIINKQTTKERPENEELDELEGPNGWKPSLTDFDGLRISALTDDLPVAKINDEIQVENLVDVLNALIDKVNTLRIQPVKVPPSAREDQRLNEIADFQITRTTSETHLIPDHLSSSLDLRYFQVTIKCLPITSFS
jgi:hypothetical protein